MSGRRGRNPLPFVVNSRILLPPAVPTIFAEYSGSGQVVLGTSITLTLPPGNPGQLMVALIGAANPLSIAWPGPWTLIGEAYSLVGGVLHMAARIRQAGDTNPTFTFAQLTGGVGWCFGFTPNVGSLTLTGATAIGNAGNSAAMSTPALTLTGTKNLLLVGALRHVFWNTFHNSLQAASLPALDPAGVGGQIPPFAVLTNRFENMFFGTRTSPTMGVQMFALSDVPAGSTGAFSSTIPSSQWALLPAGFRWNFP